MMNSVRTVLHIKCHKLKLTAVWESTVKSYDYAW